MKKAGQIILLVGIVMSIYTTFSFFTKEDAFEIGDVQFSINKLHKVKWPPFIGLMVMGVGGFIIMKAVKKK